MSLFISEAMAEGGAAAAAGPSAVPQLVMLGGFLLIFYFLLWRPQSKRQKEHRDLVGGLGKGDEVVMNGGLMGKVVKVDEEYAVIEIANNVEVKIQKSAVAAVLPKGTLKAI